MNVLPTSILATFSSSAINGSSNSTNDLKCLKFQDWEITVLTVYILLVAVLGIVFNVFVLMVFCFHKKACTVAEIYLSNLAAADLILVSCLPLWAVYAYKKFNWPFGSPMCQMITHAIVMNAYCSIYFLVLVSIDRYLALVHPLSHETMRRPKYAKFSCLLVWVLGLILGTPTFMYRKTKYLPECNVTICQNEFPTPNVELLSEGLLIMFSFIIPFSIISFCTFKIFQALKKRLNAQNMEHKATTLVLAVLAAFLVCWVPFHLVKLVEMFKIAQILSDNIRTILIPSKSIVMYLAFFNSALNPILYVIVGKKFQKKVKELFKQWGIKRTGRLRFDSMRSYMSRSEKPTQSVRL